MTVIASVPMYRKARKKMFILLLTIVKIWIDEVVGKRKSIFTDDCGAWSDSSSTKKHHYISQNDSFIYLEVKNGLFARYSKGEKCPMSPQPNMDDILILKRYYTTLKREPQYKKRITWVEKFPRKTEQNALKCLAVVEYIGPFPKVPAPHGNAKRTNTEYIRSSEAAKCKLVKKMNTFAPPRKVYEEMVLEDTITAPQDLKQVQNTKYLQNKKNRCKASNESLHCASCNPYQLMQRFF